MSIQSEITRISGNVSDAFDAVTAKGGTVPTGATSDDLATAINSIQAGGGLPDGIIDLTSSIDGPKSGYKITDEYAYTGYYQICKNSSAWSTRYSYFVTIPMDRSTETNVSDLGTLIISYDNRDLNPATTANLISTRVAWSTTNPVTTASTKITNTDGTYAGQYGTTKLRSGRVYEVHHLWVYGSDSLATVPSQIYVCIDTLGQYIFSRDGGLKVYYIPYALPPSGGSLAWNVIRNGSQTITKGSWSQGYDEVSTVNLSVSVPSSSTTLSWYTYGGTVVPVGGSVSLSLGSLGINRNTPFYAVFQGGAGTGSASARLTSILCFNGNGQAKGGFTAQYSDSSSSICAKFNLASCQMNSDGTVIVYFSTKYNPGGSSSALSYKMAIFH